MKGTRFANLIAISKNYTSSFTSWFTHNIFLKHIYLNESIDIQKFLNKLF